ncbi:MAG: M28 family peptidase [Clostridia bacterium]|nr:M28 family peptidase [Clostridia bacterium]
MKDYLSEVNARFPIRRSSQQKALFCDYVREEIGEDRVAFETLDNRHKNVIIGNISEAEVVFTAHYDTPAASVIPNLMIPANKLLSILYHMLYPLILSIASLALALMFGNVFSMQQTAIIFIYLALYLGVYYTTTRLFSNKNNKNDNTSGVATVLSVASNTNNSKVAFVLFDNEEKGLEGSKAFNKKHKNLMKNKLVVNFDCVGNGDQIVLILKDAATRLSQFDALKSTLISNEKYTVHYLQNKSSVANSDHKSFLCGVGVMACNKGSRVRFYTGRIHTARDTVANSENIYFLADKISRFIDSM